jgi:hypothetical protein
MFLKLSSFVEPFLTLKVKKVEYMNFYLHFIYSARRLMGSRIIESHAYCNQMLLAPLYINSV